MNLKKYLMILSLFIVLMCAINAINAVSDDTCNVTSEISTIEEVSVNNETDVVTIQQENDSNNASDVLSENVNAWGDEKLNEANDDSAKANLKLVNYTNFVKKGSTYYLYLTDSSGKAVVNKKVTVNIDGTTYTKTTDSNGRFGVVVNSTGTSSSMNVTFKGDNYYNAFTKTFNVYIENSLAITIGNTKLLTNGYLRVYLTGPKSSIANKSIKIKIGSKVFTKKTNAEGFVVIKPQVSANTYTVYVECGNYAVSKKIKCIKGNVKNPLKTKIKMVNGLPDIDVMPANYVMANGDGQYSLTKAQYKAVLKRDSYCLFLYNKLSKYTFFKSKASPKIYHVIKREKWNVIEQAINIKMVKKNSYSYWPGSITVNLKGKSLTYAEVRDTQNTEYTCGPTAASVCSQVLKNYYSEKYFQKKAHVTSGVNIPVLKKALENSKFKVSYFYSMSTAIKQLAKGGAAVIAYLPNHYVSVIDVSKDGKKVLVSNSYGKYNVGGATKIPTNWVSLKKFNAKFKGIGLVVKLNYKLSKKVKTQVSNYYSSMGSNWARQNTNERIPDIGL